MSGAWPSALARGWTMLVLEQLLSGPRVTSVENAAEFVFADDSEQTDPFAATCPPAAGIVSFEV
jgi:hypothetical protein